MNVGDPSFGTTWSTDGTYFSIRKMTGIDVTYHFYTRWGAEAQYVFNPISQWNDVHDVLQSSSGPRLGGSVGRRFEIGIRPYVGSDGVAVSGASMQIVFAYGANAVVRFLVL